MPRGVRRADGTWGRVTKERHYDGRENATMPPPPHNPGVRFLLIDYAHIWIADTLYITVWSDVKCHLYLKWTNKPLGMHFKTESLGGLRFMVDPRYCFVETNIIEQNEEGDTFTHTFDWPGWYPCCTRWYLFTGTMSGAISPSITCIFQAHYKDYKTARKSYKLFTLPIVASEDDCHRWNENFYLTADLLQYGRLVGDNNYEAGFRFQNIPIGPDDVPTYARLAIRAGQTMGQTVIQLAAELNPDPAPFSTYEDFMARSRLIIGPFTVFNPVTIGQWYSYDVQGFFRFLIALTGWKKNNSMVFFFETVPIAIRTHKAYSWDEGTHENAPILTLFFD